MAWYNPVTWVKRAPTKSTTKEVGGVILTEKEASSMKDVPANAIIVPSTPTTKQVVQAGVDASKVVIRRGGGGSVNQPTVVAETSQPVGSVGALAEGEKIIFKEGITPQKIDTKSMTPSQKFDYYYNRADFNLGGYLPNQIPTFQPGAPVRFKNVGGYTPAQVKDIKTAEERGKQYRELLDLSFNEVALLATKSSVGEAIKWGGNTYYPSTVQEVLVKKASDELGKIQERELTPKIEDLKKQEELNINQFEKQKIYEYNEFYQKLQDDVNSGKISAENANKQLTANKKGIEKEIDVMVKKTNEILSTKYKDVEKDWWEHRGKYVERSYLENISNVGSIQGLKSAGSIPKIALTATTAVVGGGAFQVARATGVISSSVAKVAGIGLFGVGTAITGTAVGTSLYKQQQAQGFLTGTNVVATVVPPITHLVVGVAGAYAGAKIVDSILLSRAQPSIDTFKTNLIKDTTLQKRYFTDKNIKQGYFEKDIKGIKVRINIDKTLVDKINLYNVAKREGVILKTDYTIAGKTTKTELSNSLKEYLKTDKIKISESSIGKLNAETATRLTGQTTNIKDWYVVKGSTSVNGKTTAVEFLVRYTKSGGIKEMKVISGFMNTEGVGLFEVGRVVKTPVKAKFAVDSQSSLEVTTIGVKPEKVINIFGKTISVKNIPTKTGQVATITEMKTSTLGLEGAKVNRAVNYKAFGKTEPLFEFITKSKMASAKSFSLLETGKSTRLEIFGQPEVSETGILQKTKSIFYETGSGKTFEKPLSYSISKPMKIWGKPTPSFELPSKTSGGETIFIEKPIAPKPAPSYVGGEGGAGSASLFQFDKSSAFFSKGDFTGAVIRSALSPAVTRAPPITSQAFSSNNYGAGALVSGLMIDTPEDKRGLISGLDKGGLQTGLLSNVNLEDQFKRTITPAQKGGTTTGFFQTPIQDLITTPIIKPITITPTITPPYKFTKLTIPPIKPLPILPIAFLGDIQTGGGQKGRRTKVSNLFLPKYNPSLGAVLTKQKKKITAKEASLLSLKRYSGLESRPMFEIIPEKKKKKK